METKVDRKKVKVVLIYKQIRDNLKLIEQPLYVGYTEGDEGRFLSSFKAMVRTHNEALSHKLQDIHNVNLNDLQIKRVSNCFLDQAAETVNKYIIKYDTIENGWNTVERQ